MSQPPWQRPGECPLMNLFECDIDKLQEIINGRVYMYLADTECEDCGCETTMSSVFPAAANLMNFGYWILFIYSFFFGEISTQFPWHLAKWKTRQNGERYFTKWGPSDRILRLQSVWQVYDFLAAFWLSLPPLCRKLKRISNSYVMSRRPINISAPFCGLPSILMSSLNSHAWL